MKAIMVLLLLASLALNVCFLTGCKTLHDAVYGNPCKYSEQIGPKSGKEDGKADFLRIAGLLDINTSGKTASDLASDICYKLDRSADVPTVYSDAAFEKMAKDLNSEQEAAMRGYQRFISELQGKRLIVVSPEE